MNDHELFETLTSALAPAHIPVAPPAASMIVLHRVVDATTFPTRPDRHVRWPRLLPLAVAAGVAAACVGVAVMTSSRNDVSPELGPASESPQLLQARSRLVGLRAALDAGDLERVAVAAVELRRAMSRLDSIERAQLEPDVTRMLDRAQLALTRPPSPSASIVSTSSTAPPSSALATSPATSAPMAGALATQPPRPTSSPTTSPITDDGDVDDDHSGPGGDADESLDSVDDNGGPSGADDDGGGHGDSGSGSGSGSDGGGEIEIETND